jgi:hypothetical protein
MSRKSERDRTEYAIAKFSKYIYIELARLPDWIILNLWGTVSLPGQIYK